MINRIKAIKLSEEVLSKDFSPRLSQIINNAKKHCMESRGVDIETFAKECENIGRVIDDIYLRYKCIEVPLLCVTSIFLALIVDTILKLEDKISEN